MSFSCSTSALSTSRCSGLRSWVKISLNWRVRSPGLREELKTSIRFIIVSEVLSISVRSSCSWLNSSSDVLAEPGPGRSEEHTSELQSHSDLVCRLLLEKKNMKK